MQNNSKNAEKLQGIILPAYLKPEKSFNAHIQSQLSWQYLLQGLKII